MYGERFDIPTPDKLIFISWYEGGEVFRSGCTFERGHGRIFYFSPGHEIYPIYHDPVIQQIIINATRWAAPRVQIPYDCPNANKPLEPIKSKR
jgi:trehalose utilization protein